MILEQMCMGCMQDKGEVEECPYCGLVEGTPPESPQHLSPRTILNDKYLIGVVLGQGGFGITYLAWDLNLNIKLAVKEYMPQELASRAAGYSTVTPYTGAMENQFQYGLEKFLQEARTLAQFEGHPSIVSVRDFFQANGTAYLVMHYIEGATLKSYVAQEGGTLPFEKILKIMMPVMDALKEVHAVGILHRDISPDNIFINLKGQVILIDFGAARQAIGEKGRSLSIIMKPGYTPEEQYRSKGVQGPWTDIYAVAATMYRIVTGQMPPESLDRLEEDTLVPPSRLGVKIGGREEEALLKALAIRAGDRFPSMAEFQEALLGGGIFQAEPAPSLNRISPKPEVPHSFSPPPTSSSASYSAQQGSGYASGPRFISKIKDVLQQRPAFIYLAGGGTVLVFVLVFAVVSFLGNSAPPSQAESLRGINGVQDTGNLDGGELQTGTDAHSEVEVRYGTLEYREGTYTGEHDGDKPHGEGTWEGPEGEEYQGQWQEGLPHGEGVLLGPDGETYEGEWKEGKRSGYGNYVSANQVRYAGDWENDRRSGFGTETWPNGAEYVGEWHEDLRNGQGTYTWPNGAQYVGEWKDGYQHGEGTLTHADGSVQSGTWINNEYQN